MANLYVLEGYGQRDSKRKVIRKNFRKNSGFRSIPGIIQDERFEDFLGRALFTKLKKAAKSAVKVVAAPVTTTYSVAKSAGKAVVNVAKKPTLTNLTKVVTNPTKRLVSEVKSTGKEAGHTVAETSRVVNTAASRSLNVTRRVAKRLIKKIAKSVLFRGELLGSVAVVSKNAAKGILIPPATAAVLANTVTAPAAPLVPVIANEVINELYSKVEEGVKKGLSPSDAAKNAKDSLDVLEPGEENDPSIGGGFGTILLVGGLGFLAYYILKD